MSSKLWTPERKLWAPFEGKVRLQVGWPDNPANPGEETDTGWEHNTVLPYLPYMLWSALNPFDSSYGVRYLDGTLVYPSWGDVFAGYTTTTGGGALVNNFSLGSAAETSPSPVSATGFIGTLFKWLLNGLAIGNYTAAAPSGNTSVITTANWTTYSLLRRFAHDLGSGGVGGPGSDFVGNASNVYFGPAISSSSITGVGPPNASTTVTRTFSAQAGTVNAIAFAPLSLAATGVSTQITPSASVTQPNFLQALVGGAGLNQSPGAFMQALAASGEPFTTGLNAILSTLYLASAAVTIATGAQLTMSYQLSVTL